MNVGNFDCNTLKSNVFKNFIILCFTRLRLISCYMTNEKFSDACHFSLHHTRSKITLNSNSMSYMQTYPLSLMQLLNFYLLYNFGEEQLKIRVQNERRVHVNHYLHTLHFLFTHTQKQIRKCTLDNNMIFEYYSPNFTIAKNLSNI